MKTVLVTGGAGFIGSHTVVQLLNCGLQVVILDNLVNSKASVIDRIFAITKKMPIFIEGNIRDSRLLEKIFNEYQIDSVIHFAGLKAAGQSTQIPLMYYDANVLGTLTLLKQMSNSGVKKLVFSSSATVYGDPDIVPINETAHIRPKSPYGQSKLAIEIILKDLYKSDNEWAIISLRYFNPVGAHESALLGEDPFGIPSNLMPIVSRVASKKCPKLQIYGDDYSTPDGTGVRDYVHVQDLAMGHIAALNYLQECAEPIAVNLGTGNGYSVLELIHTYEKISGEIIPYEIIGRRPGDIGSCYADVRLAKIILNWSANLDLSRMCQDSWRWQIMNPNGY